MGKKSKNHISTFLIIVGLITVLVPMGMLIRYRLPQNSLYHQNIQQETINTDGKEVGEDIGIEEIEGEEALSAEEFLSTLSQMGRDDYTDGLMDIHIPKIEVQAAVINGTTDAHLKKGPGLYEISPLPYEIEGNVLIAGHRTTYGAWFRHVDQLIEGDDIIIDFEEVAYHYQVEKVFIVEHNDWSVTEAVGYSVLTLTSCHPLRSDRQRIVVRAKLNEVRFKDNIYKIEKI